MTEMFELAVFAFKSIVTVLLVALAGIFLIRFKFLKEESLKTLSQCVFAVMLPCLLFSKVSVCIDFRALAANWAVPVCCAVFVSAGLLTGFATAKLLKYPEGFFKPAIAASAFGNISFIPIPLIAAIAMVFPCFASDPSSSGRGIAYISLFLMVYSPMLWSVGFKLLSAKDVSGGNGEGLLELVNPPLVGMAAGVLVGTVPFLKGFFVGSNAPLGPLFNAIGILGAAAVPCALISLGGRLADGPGDCKLPWRVVLGAGLVKQIFLPAFALACVWLGMKAGVLPRDPLLAVVLVIEAAVPQATNLQIICSLRNPAIEKDMSCLLFWNYLAAAPILAFYIIMALKTTS